MTDLVISGRGGAAREVRAIIDRVNEKAPTYNFMGFVVNGEEGEDVFGTDEDLLKYDKPIAVVIAVGKMSLRKKLSEIYRQNKNAIFPNVIDPDVLMTGNPILGEGNIICPGTIITVNVEIGSFCYINMACTIAHEDVIEDYVSINPRCNLSGAVHVRSLTELGTGTAVVQGVTIGTETDIWSGSSVIKNIPDRCVAYGVPAKVLYHKDR